MTHSLYRCYGPGDDLLYVGLSVDPDNRLQQHVTQSRWWDEVERVTVHGGFPDRESGRIAERLAIAWEAPRENVEGAVKFDLGPGRRADWANVSVTLPPDLAAALRTQAQRNHRSVSGEIRFLIRQSCDAEREAT